LIVHVSGTQAIEQIHWAQGRGLRVYAETCPQYLFLTAEDLNLNGFEGAKCVCSPPPRDESNQESVWEGLENGTFQVFSSDHAPFRYEDSQGKKAAGEDASFQHIPNGIPGLETRLPLLFSEGVLMGRLDITRFVALTSTNPARIYGLYPRKGSITVGADADMAIWDPNGEWTVKNENLHHDVDYSPYEGMKLRGRLKVTVSRGQAVFRDGVYLGSAGTGEFLTRERPQPARPRGESRGF